MNYVAHILLTHPYEQITVGNMIGDMARNRDLDAVAPAIREGVYVHRKIDSVTDQMPEMRKAAIPLRERHGKYAPVVLDILLDFVLVERWSEFSSVPFTDSEEWTYDLIDRYHNNVPYRIARNLLSMAQHRWLNDYTSREGLVRVMRRMDRRASFNSRFAEAGQDLDEQMDMLSSTLDVIWPELVRTVEEEITLRSEERS